jgi:hypothetical protein
MSPIVDDVPQYIDPDVAMAVLQRRHFFFFFFLDLQDGMCTEHIQCGNSTTERERGGKWGKQQRFMKMSMRDTETTKECSAHETSERQ